MRRALHFVVLSCFIVGTAALAGQAEAFKSKFKRLSQNKVNFFKVTARPGEEVPEATLNLAFGPGATIEVAAGRVRDIPDMLEQEDFVAVVNRNLRAVKFCYCEALKKDPAFEGEAIVGMQIKTDGSVKQVDIEPGDMAENAFGRCLSPRASRWQFPKFKGVKEEGLTVQSVGYEFPLAFNQTE